MRTRHTRGTGWNYHLNLMRQKQCRNLDSSLHPLISLCWIAVQWTLLVIPLIPVQKQIIKKYLQNYQTPTTLNTTVTTWIYFSINPRLELCWKWDWIVILTITIDHHMELRWNEMKLRFCFCGVFLLQGKYLQVWKEGVKLLTVNLLAPLSDPPPPSLDPPLTFLNPVTYCLPLQGA